MSEMKTSESLPLRITSWVAACTPIVCLSFIVVSAAYIRMKLGRWPVVYVDSVRAPFADAAVTAAALSAVALFPTILLLPLLAAFRAMSRVRPVFGRWAVVLAITWVVACALITWDPTGFFDWVLD